jgi:signal transduction histidine kinase
MLAAVAAVSVGIACEGGGAVSSLRHLYVLVALIAAGLRGALGGVLTGLFAGCLQAPLVFPLLERRGVDGASIDALLSLITALVFGWLVGELADRAGARAARLRALLEVQEALARDAPLEERARRVVEAVQRVLGAARAALLVGDGARAPLIVAIPPDPAYDPGSAAAWCLAGGRAVASPDLVSDPRFGALAPETGRPTRAQVLPLEAGGAIAGALALEWEGDRPPRAGAAAEEMAVHLGLALENARLAVLQRAFTEELEGKVAEATARLRELDRAKSEFVSVVSHELRTPLTALQGFTELLLTRDVPPERARRFIGHLHTEAGRLVRIVGQLLDLSRIEAGHGDPLRRIPVNLAEVIERNVDLCAAAHPSHQFRADICRPLPPALGDPDAIDGVLKNLLANAVKYSPRGGEVRVRVEAGVEGEAMVALVIEDEGIGIPAEMLPRIFDRYFRVASVDTAAVRGLGLGLTLVRALVEGQGGRVEAESTPGVGSRFRVVLPSGGAPS